MPTPASARPTVARPLLTVGATHALVGDVDRRAYAEAVRSLAAVVPSWRKEAERGLDGEFAFLVPAGGAGVVEAIEAHAAAADPRSTLIVAGIGGSALAPRCFGALRRRWVRSQELVVLDTADPDAVAELMAQRHPRGTRLIGVSKSGTTLESSAVFEVLEGWLRDELGADGARAAISVVAGDEANPLRQRAVERGYPLFGLAPRIGGRFSALTAVGLLPAAFLDVDIAALVAGARSITPALLDPDPAVNPALHLAALLHAAWCAGRSVNVVMPYGERLRPLGPWWAQLLGESLGKQGPTGPVGPAPIAAAGPADQHSLLQRLLQGPDDTVTVLVEAAPTAGRTRAHEVLGPIQAASIEATRHALAAHDRPVATVRLQAADEASVGAFLVTWEVATVAWAHLLGVNPQGQPAVQSGKDVAAVLLGTRDDPALRAAIDARRAREATTG